MSVHSGSAVGSSLSLDEHHAGDDQLRMHEGIAQDWALWSRLIGEQALPRLEQLRTALPTMTSCVLSTADGLNLCAIDVQPDAVGRLAALNSSLFAVASAKAEVISGHGASPWRTVVHLTFGDSHVVMVSLVQEPLGHLLLSVSADHVQLGQLVVHVRQAAEDLRGWLSGKR